MTSSEDDGKGEAGDTDEGGMLRTEQVAFRSLSQNKFRNTERLQEETWPELDFMITLATVQRMNWKPKRLHKDQ